MDFLPPGFQETFDKKKLVFNAIESSLFFPLKNGTKSKKIKTYYQYNNRYDGKF